MLIYIYIFICVSLIVFNGCYAVIIKMVDRRINKNTYNYHNDILKQIENIQRGAGVLDSHKKLLYKKLKSVSNLTSFDKSLEEIYKTYPSETEKYLLGIYSVFMYLSGEYKKKDSIKTAYLPYVISKYNLISTKKSAFIIDAVLDLLYAKNVYCRENALKAIYNMGDALYVIKALKIIDSQNCFHHPKLICDGLMTFNGDKEALASLLWENFESFSYEMQVNILNFIRFSGIRNDEKLLALLTDKGQDKEIRLSAIRYFEKFYFPDAMEILHSFAKNENEMDWEYQAISSSALKTYPCKATEQILKSNLSSSNWYVRYNSSESCERLNLSYSDLIDVFNGNDRYAREMVKYRFDRKSAQKEVVIK